VLKIAFFTEAGSKRGYGHLIRSYTIYENFKHLDATFFLDSDINFDYKFDDISYFKWHNLDINTEYDIIFIDSYIADLTIYKFLQKHAKIAIYIDDYARIEYPQGVVINFAPDAEELFYKSKKQNYVYLLGMKYIPIRQEFININPPKQEQLFIMLGGMDIANISLDIMEALKDEEIAKVIVHNDKETVKKLQQFQNTKVLFKPTDTQLIKSMKESSLAITTASMSAYEFSYAQIPTIIIGISDNQDASQITERNISSYSVSTQEKDWLKKLKQYVEKNPSPPASTIDALGCERIFSEVMALV
jgi:spore coat polysaccharide biosynthesis predicted glycosyltransferase SpsG